MITCTSAGLRSLKMWLRITSGFKQAEGNFVSLISLYGLKAVLSLILDT